MKFEIFNGMYLGTAEWEGPGRVTVAIDDDRERRFFESYFTTEYPYLTGTVDCPGMSEERPDQDEAAFARALARLNQFDYRVTPADEARDGSP